MVLVQFESLKSKLFNGTKTIFLASSDQKLRQKYGGDQFYRILIVTFDRYVLEKWFWYHLIA